MSSFETDPITPNTPESFGLYPGDEGYETFGEDFPSTETSVGDYSTDGQEVGECGSQEPIVFPETAEEESRRVGEYFANHPLGKQGTL